MQFLDFYNVFLVELFREHGDVLQVVLVALQNGRLLLFAVQLVDDVRVLVVDANGLVNDVDERLFVQFRFQPVVEPDDLEEPFERARVGNAARKGLDFLQTLVLVQNHPQRLFAFVFVLLRRVLQAVSVRLFVVRVRLLNQNRYQLAVQNVVDFVDRGPVVFLMESQKEVEGIRLRKRQNEKQVEKLFRLLWQVGEIHVEIVDLLVKVPELFRHHTQSVVELVFVSWIVERLHSGHLFHRFRRFRIDERIPERFFAHIEVHFLNETVVEDVFLVVERRSLQNEIHQTLSEVVVFFEHVVVLEFFKNGHFRLIFRPNHRHSVV